MPPSPSPPFTVPATSIWQSAVVLDLISTTAVLQVADMAYMERMGRGALPDALPDCWCFSSGVP
jgi:hypothetical protein